MEENVVISVKNLKKSFGKKVVFENFSVDILENQIIGLIGANGSGKTTFFNMCLGVENISGGELKIFGGNPVSDDKVRSNILYSSNILPVGKNERLKDVLNYYRISYGGFDMEFALKILEIFKVNPKLIYKTLSQGMKSMFHFACAIAARCKLTLLDESFNGMDIENRKVAYEILLRDYMENPRTIIISSHNLGEMENVLSQMILINNGKLFFYKDMDDVRQMLVRIEGSEECMGRLLEKHSDAKILDKAHSATGGTKITVEREGSVALINEALASGDYNVSSLSPEDVCITLTGENKEEKLDELWSK